MEYTPQTAVWEITMGCNMRCGHCGSACAAPLPDELTTAEALAVIDSMKALGMRWITLSGGEPLTRKDWPLLAKKLTASGIIPNIITNGWLLTEETVKTARECGVETISISLDGVRETHDRIRKPGSFDKIMQAYKILDKWNHTSAANTTVTQENLGELESIKEILIREKVKLWQIQIGMPMGNMARKRDAVLKPETVEFLIDFAHRTTLENKIKVFPADCLGYFTGKEGITRMLSIGSPQLVLWQGCNAGKRSFGLLHNGDVLGCTSIRDRSYIEGNIRERSLEDIWNSKKSFQWARNMVKADLSGDCRQCIYGDVCLGGCPNMRLTMNQNLYSDNPYCVYHLAMQETRESLSKYNDIPELMDTAQGFVNNNNWQLAALTLARVLELEKDNQAALALNGFVNFNLKNYSEAQKSNEAILATDPDNVYALKGLGLSLHRLQKTDEGISFLKKATELAQKPEEMDAFYDLYVVYNELQRNQEAVAILQKGEEKSPGLINRMRPYYTAM